MAPQKAVPHLWRCEEDIEPILNRAVELIKMDDSERRSLVLMNPGLAPKRRCTPGHPNAALALEK